MKTINIKDITESKVFCTAPWTHLHSHPNGDVIACCLSPSDKVLGNLNDNTLEEIWNSDRLKQLRLNMLNDVRDEEICSRCYTKEDEGFQSLRTGMNEKYRASEFDAVQSTQDDGTVETFNLIHWDFRFSNLCNLSCRSCGPGLSSSWSADHKKIFPLTIDDKALIQLPDNRNSMLLDAALKNIDKVKSIHFAGGEPMMMKEHWIILEELQKANRRDVQLHYSTNMTKFNYGKKHAFDYWHDFESVYVSASVDDIGHRFNYIRNGGKWADVATNLQAIKDQKFKNLTLAFHPTLSVFNIFSFPDLVKFVWDNGSFTEKLRPHQIIQYYIHVVNLNPLTYPDFYSMTILPDDMKKKAAEGIEELMKWSQDNMVIHESHHNVPDNKHVDVAPLQSLIDFMYAKDDTEKISTFVTYTQNLDQIRGQNVFETMPELLPLATYG